MTEPHAPPSVTRWQALDTLQQAGVSVFVSMSPTYPTMDEDDFHELLSYFRALGEVVVFHEPINPRGANFQQCLNAAKEAGYDDVVTELQQMQDSHQYWVEYALAQLKRFNRSRRASMGSKCIPALMMSWCARRTANSGQSSRQCNRLCHQSRSPSMIQTPRLSNRS
ncbi:radical SAM domain-containing protein [Haloarcula argentinensis DSM 12282]|nr:radical SAM domain-containing protein [Haloarcula argentinensis DSM 12282]